MGPGLPRAPQPKEIGAFLPQREVLA